MSPLGTAPLAAGLALGLTHLLARLAPRLGWLDAAHGPDAARKLQARPVPPVGGAALLLTWVLLPELRGSFAPLALGGLVALLAVGTWDDLRRGGLRPGAKLLAQALGLVPLALHAAALQGSAPPGPLACGLALGAGLVALNVANTWDHADGALAGVLAPGLLVLAPGLGGGLLGFAAANLDTRAGRPTPTAYLGDAGAFLLGGLVLVEPRLAGGLVLPLLDLARLSWVRWREGGRPWVGDRRHLGHRLRGRGLGPRAVAGVLALVSAPAGLGLALGGGAAGAAGVAGTVLGWWLVLRRTPESDAAPASACPGGRCGE